MRKEKAVPDKEILYVWSGGGIEQVHKEAVESPPPHPEAEPKRVPRPEDQRRYARLDLKLPILYKILGHNSSRIPVNVRPYLLTQSTNISPLGLCVNLADRLDNGAVLALTIHDMDKREKFTAIGRVVWTKPSDAPGQFLTGVEFVVVDENKIQKESHLRMEMLLKELGPKE